MTRRGGIDVNGLLGSLEPVSLDALEDRAALLRRVDRKYALRLSEFENLMRVLGESHQILEIDGDRVFGYSTTYFETPDLRCFTDHVEDRLPRFKARTRLYENSGECVFEVKLKRGDDKTDKRQIDYAAERRRQLTDDARACMESALADAGLEPPGEMRASLTSAFARTTVAARESPERLTCDFDVRLMARAGDVIAMRRGLVLVETKSEGGDSPADRELERMGISTISMSKYRVGMSTVGGAEHFGTQPGAEFFG